MTVKYLDAKKIQGSSTGLPSVATKEFDFTDDDNWSLGNSGTGDNSVTIDTGNEYVNLYKIENITADPRRVAYDLQTYDSFTMSNSNWRCDFELYWVDSGSGNSTGQALGFSDGDNQMITGSDDGIDCIALSMGGNSTTPKISINNQHGGTSYTTSEVTCAFGTTLYCRLERLSTTKVSFSVFTDSARTTHRATSPQTVEDAGIANITDLDWLVMANRAQGSGDRESTFRILDVKIYNGQDDKATLVTAGTNSDWTSTTGWTFGSNKHTVNNSTASVTRLTYYDLGSNQPDAWVIRFKMAFTGWENNGSAGQGIHFDIGMVDDATSATMNNENITGLDSVYARLASGEWACQSTNGSSTLNYAQFNTFSRPYTATYWVEVRKLSTTQAQVKLWLSSDYDEDPDEESDVMTLSANPDCRYIFARLFYQSVTSDNTIDISEFEYYNSLSTVTPTYETDFAEPFSNLPENTIFNETDTYLQYWLQDSIWKSSFIGRGLFGGAYYPDGKSIKFITVQTTGTVTDFGDLTNARGLGYASASRDLGRALFAGGYGGSDGNGGGSDVNWQNIDYVNVHSVGDASDFGDLNIAKRGGAGFGSQTRASFAGGYN